jgi:hypothetical protein
MRKISGTILTIGILVVQTALAALAQDQAPQSPVSSNLEVMRTLARRIGTSIGRQMAHTDSTSVEVIVYPPDHAWYIDAALLEGIRDRGVRVTGKSGSDYRVEIGLSNLKVAYSNVRQDGFFGSRVLDRTVVVDVSVKIVPENSAEEVTAREFLEENHDTILVSAIQTVENPAVPVTQGSIPQEGFFSHFAEPLILIGALAVGIYLLFTVRS